MKFIFPLNYFPRSYWPLGLVVPEPISLSAQILRLSPLSGKPLLPGAGHLSMQIDQPSLTADFNSSRKI